MTDLERYFTALLDGKIPACRRMKQVAQRLLENLACPGEFHFDPDIAQRHIEFIQRFCRVPSGRLGSPCGWSCSSGPGSRPSLALWTTTICASITRR